MASDTQQADDAAIARPTKGPQAIRSRPRLGARDYPPECVLLWRQQLAVKRMEEMESKQASTTRIASALTLLAISWPALAQESNATPLSLERALELATENNPAIEAARQRIAEAKGDLIGASLLLANNPQLAVGAGPRFGSSTQDSTTLDLDIGLRQRFELGGQRGHRIERASAIARSNEAAEQDVRRVLELAVTLAFHDAVASSRLVAIREQAQELAERLFQVASRRVELGAGAALELNTARVRRAEAQRRLASARATDRSAQLYLRQLTAIPAVTPLTVQSPSQSRHLNQKEDALVRRALGHRPDLRVIAQRIDAARASVELADAEAWPDVSVGVSYGREEGNNIIRGGIRVPLPLFNRNQGPRHRARASVARLQATHAERRLAVESEVRRAHTQYSQARDALALYDADVLQAQEESLGLLQRAFEAGQIDYANVITVQREVIDGREGLVEVRRALSRATAVLLASAVISITGANEGRQP